MPMIATSSPEEPDDEDRGRQELRRLLSECVEQAPTGSLPSEAVFGIMYWLDAPFEESDRKRRQHLLLEELQSSKKPSGLRWFLQLLVRSVAERHRRRSALRRASWPNGHEPLTDADASRILEALSRVVKLRWQAAKFDRLRYIKGFSLDDAAKLMGKDMHAAGRIADFQLAWLRYQLDRGSRESGNAGPADRPAEDLDARNARLKRMFEENYDDMRRIVEALCNREEAMPSRCGGLSSDDLLHEVCLRAVDDPRLDLEDRRAFLGLISRIAAQTIVDIQRRNRQRVVKPGAPAGASSEAPHSDGGMLRRAWRTVMRCCRTVLRTG